MEIWQIFQKRKRKFRKFYTKKTHLSKKIPNFFAPKRKKLLKKIITLQQCFCLFFPCDVAKVIIIQEQKQKSQIWLLPDIEF